MAALDALPEAGSSGWFSGMPPIGPIAGLVNAPRNSESPSNPHSRREVIPQIAKGGSLLASRPDSQTKPTRRASDVLGELSERERHELNELRQEMEELAMERDAVARLIKEAIRP